MPALAIGESADAGAALAGCRPRPGRAWSSHRSFFRGCPLQPEAGERGELCPSVRACQTSGLRCRASHLPMSMPWTVTPGVTTEGEVSDEAQATRKHLGCGKRLR